MGNIAAIAKQQQTTVIEPSKIDAVPITTADGAKVMIRAEDLPLFVEGAGSVSQKEIVSFMMMCRVWNVNPYLKEAYLIKYGSSPASMIVAEKVYEQRADSQPGYKGMKYGVIFEDANGNEQKREGKRINKRRGEVLVGAWAEVYREGRETTYTEIDFDEYAGKKKDGSLNSQWSTKPATMLCKCVKAAALRDAYPNAFAGMYIAEEMGAAGSETEVEAIVEDVQETGKVAESAEPIEYDTTAEGEATAEQQNDITRLCGQLAELRGVSNAKMMAALIKSKAVKDAGYDGSEAMTVGQANACILQLSKWLEKAVDPETGEVK